MLIDKVDKVVKAPALKEPCAKERLTSGFKVVVQLLQDVVMIYEPFLLSTGLNSDSEILDVAVLVVVAHLNCR